MLSLLVAGFVMGCSGSGPQRAEVSGTVKLNGELVEEGAISFIPVEGTTGPQAGEAIRKGTYHIARAKGVVVGKNRVQLVAFRKSGKKIQDPTKLPGVLTDERVQAFPPEYNTESTLVREIKPDGNIIDFEIDTK